MRTERWQGGQLVAVETWDADRYVREEPPGEVVEDRPLTDDERDMLAEAAPPDLEGRFEELLVVLKEREVIDDDDEARIRDDDGGRS